MSLVVLVSLPHVKDALQRQWPYTPQPWEEHSHRWLQVEDLAPTHAVGHADMEWMVVLEGAGYWACVRVEQWGLVGIVVTTDMLVRQRSKGSVCYGVLRYHLRFMGPVRLVQRCSPGSIPSTRVVFVQVSKQPRIAGRMYGP